MSFYQDIVITWHASSKIVLCKAANFSANHQFHYSNDCSDVHFWNVTVTEPRCTTIFIVVVVKSDKLSK